MNYFKFRNVGQGLFYTGSLMHKTYNFVYDCGCIGANSQIFLQKQIDEFVLDISNHNSKPKIDFVVISHLDRDHFNGLRELSKKTTISHLYLPYLPQDKNIKVFLLACTLLDMDGSNNYSQYRSTEFLFALELYNLTDSGELVHNIENITFDIGGFADQNSEIIKYKFSFKGYWEFVLFNKTVSKSILTELHNRICSFLEEEGCDDLLEYVYKNQNLTKLREIYDDIFKKELKMSSKNTDNSIINATSIALLHYPLYNNPTSFLVENSSIRDRYLCAKFNRCCRYINYCNMLFDNASASLLTGDIVFDTSFYNKLKGIVGEKKLIAFQVPHHGSHKNWNINQYDLPVKNYIISFGLGNTYGHPSAQTVSDILIGNKSLSLVNQLDFFDYIID